MPSRLAGKDWTRYEGVLHTDHAVREEFFDGKRDAASTASKPYLLDFTYLYDSNQGDFKEFTGGKEFTEEEVYAEIGQPSDWSHRSKAPAVARSDEQAAIVAAQLLACRKWEDSLQNDESADTGI